MRPSWPGDRRNQRREQGSTRTHVAMRWDACLCIGNVLGALGAPGLAQGSGSPSYKAPACAEHARCTERCRAACEVFALMWARFDRSWGPSRPKFRQGSPEFDQFDRRLRSRTLRDDFPRRQRRDAVQLEGDRHGDVTTSACHIHSARRPTKLHPLGILGSCGPRRII